MNEHFLETTSQGNQRSWTRGVKFNFINELGRPPELIVYLERATEISNGADTVNSTQQLGTKKLTLESWEDTFELFDAVTETAVETKTMKHVYDVLYSLMRKALT